MAESHLLNIVEDPITDPRVIAILEAHLASMYATSPPDSVFALDLDGLRAPDVTFWSIWNGKTPIGCGALREHSGALGEIKSMHTLEAHRGIGAASVMLQHILQEAARRGYRALKLETGSHPAFQPAQNLYLKYGFTYCEAFAPYAPNAFSVFMERALEP